MQRIIEGYPNYLISDTGVVTDSLGKLRKQYITDGYAQVSLGVDGKYSLEYVHRLVAKAFIPNPDNKPQVNHKDSNRTNNHVDNLEWVTNQENTIHGFTHGFAVSSALGKKRGDSSQYHSVSFDPIKQRYVAAVYDRTTKKTICKRFTLAKYKDAEIQAAKAVNQILDSLGDTIRPRNKV